MNKHNMVWVRDLAHTGQILLMSKEAVAAMISPPEVLGDANILSALTGALERARERVLQLQTVDVEINEEAYDPAVGRTVTRRVTRRCRVVGETQGFTAELAGMLDLLVRQSISYDKIVDELITERDALRREANDLSTRIANVRKAIQPPG